MFSNPNMRNFLQFNSNTKYWQQFGLQYVIHLLEDFSGYEVIGCEFANGYEDQMYYFAFLDRGESQIILCGIDYCEGLETKTILYNGLTPERLKTELEHGCITFGAYNTPTNYFIKQIIKNIPEIFGNFVKRYVLFTPMSIFNYYQFSEDDTVDEFLSDYQQNMDTIEKVIESHNLFIEYIEKTEYKYAHSFLATPDAVEALLTILFLDHSSIFNTIEIRPDMRNLTPEEILYAR